MIKKYDPTLKEKIIARLKNHKMTLHELADKFHRTPEEMQGEIDAIISKGIPIDMNTQHNRKQVLSINTKPQLGNVYVISEKDNKPRTMDFGAASDFHFASKYHMNKTFHEAMKRLEDKGITRVYGAGDIVDGKGIYKGHDENITAISVEDQTDIAAEALSKHPNLEFWLIAGNHDFSHTQQNGARPISLLEKKCDNVKDLGDLRADVIYHGIRIRLLHGAGGRSYAVSYPSQTYLRDLFKGSERSEIENMPHMLILGHYHTMYQSKDHGIYIIQPTSFQDGENEYCIRRGLTGPNGCFAVHIEYQNGKVNEYQTEFIQPKSAEKEKGFVVKGKRIDLDENKLNKK